MIDSALRELASTHGISTEYWDWRGRHVQVGRDALVAVLAGLGVDASTPEAAQVAVTADRAARWSRMLPATVVARRGASPWFWVHVPHGEPAEVWIELEDGGRRHDIAQVDHWVDPMRIGGALIGEATYAVPSDLPAGYHALRARCGDTTATATLIVAPDRLELPAALERGRAWGFLTQLYAVRSRRSWGIGDLGDLADLAAWSGHELGAGFVLVNPLHAGSPATPIEPSPYLPASRRFANPLYLRLEAVPEAAYLGAARAEFDRLAEQGRALTDADVIDRDACWPLKRRALELLCAVELTPGRAASLAAYREREAEGLGEFATWCALAEVHGGAMKEWPDELRDARSETVAAERLRLSDAVELHVRAQWWLDEQLAAAATAARDAGMGIGVVHDLAVGVDPDGADPWVLGDLLAGDCSVGAPPDAYTQAGQDWSQPPWRPDRLAEVGYAPYRAMLRTVLRHAGGLRVDHVLGLFRLWWVPAGMPPTEGAYVRYDHEALIGILLLEAERAGAVVIGEDLGTVEPWVRDYLRERGVFGTSVLWFERGWSDEALRPEHWRELCLASVTTHDLPPTAGYLAGVHVDLRGSLGLLERAVEDERAVHDADVADWTALLVELGLLREGAGEREVVEALHRFLVRTPSRLLGVALPDAVGDRRPVNQPGTHQEYPNWRVPMTDSTGAAVLLEDLPAHPRLRSLAEAVRG